MCQSESASSRQLQQQQQSFKLKPAKIYKSNEPPVDSVPEWNRLSGAGNGPQKNATRATSGTSLEPIYFDAFGRLAPPPPGAERQAFEHYKRFLSNQDNPINSFYSVDEPQSFSHQQSEPQTGGDQLTPILLKSFAPKQLVAKQLVERPQELDFRKLDFETIQQAINNFSPTVAPNEAALFPSNQQQKASQVNQFSQPPVYKPSIVHRPKVVVNLSSLLKPGEALMSDKSRGGQPKPVSSSDLRQLFRQLEPMALKESEEPEAAKIKLMEELDELSEDNTEDFEDLSEGEKLERLRELRRRKKLNIVLPTSHLFGGSLGVVNESRINQHKPATARENDNRLASEEQMSFLKTLAKLSSNLDRKRAPAGSDYLPQSSADDNNSIDEDDFFHLTGKPATQVAENNSPPAIPIDVLVDHLMSSSRVAAFGLQHGADLRANQDSEDPGSGEEEEEEDSDEDDADNNGTLPPEAEGLIDAYESAPNHEKVLAPVSFNSVLNKSDSWVPLDSVAMRSKLLNQQLESSSESNKAQLTKKKKKRMKRQDGLDLVIGNKKLTRTELMRLIVVLNKMASQKEPSRERAASRKLLRFLVKLAIEQYKRKKKRRSRKKKENSSEDQFIRSLLTGPASLVGENNDNSVIELRTLGIPAKKQTVSDKEEEPRKAAETNQPDTSGNDKRGGSLRDMTDELENYFDSDFFEDMADKLMENRTKSNPNENAATSNLRRNRRRPYALPVPIYGRQLMEEADEDDVELDYVRIPTVPRAPKAYRHGRRKRRRRPSLSSVRSRRSGRKRDIEPEGEAEPHEQEEDEREEDEAAPNRKRGHRVAGAGRRLVDRAGNGDRDRQDSEDAEQQDNEEDGEEEEPREPGQIEDNRDDEAGQQQGSEETEKSPKKTPKRVVKNRKYPANSRGKNKKEKKRKTRRKTVGRLKKVAIDLDSRYEIPAPIEKGKALVASTKSATSKDRKSADKSKTPKATGEQTRQLPKRKRENVPAKNVNVKHNIKNRSTEARKRAASRDPDEPPTNDEGSPDEARPPETADNDYYNEGTSYSKICDDDGRCKVSVESNSPKLSEAIKTGHRPTVEKQLDKWASSDND